MQRRGDERVLKPHWICQTGFDHRIILFEAGRSRFDSILHLPVELLADLDGGSLLALQPQAVHRVGQVDRRRGRHLLVKHVHNFESRYDVRDSKLVASR